MVRSVQEVLARGTPATKTNPCYGRVVFSVRRQFGLSATECLLADVIAILSRKSGWCFASRDYLARLLGTSTRTLQRMLSRLKELELVEQHPHDVRRLRPTDRWMKTSQAAMR